jgi:hypothetical protein
MIEASHFDTKEADLLEILDASRAGVRHYSSGDPSPAADLNGTVTAAIWKRPQQSLAVAGPRAPS